MKKCKQSRSESSWNEEAVVEVKEAMNVKISPRSRCMGVRTGGFATSGVVRDYKLIQPTIFNLDVCEVKE